jgi:hypothetical protein
MAEVSAYRVLSDKQTTLRITGQNSVSFGYHIPNEVNRERQAVLTWRFEADDDPDDLKWRITVDTPEGGKEIASFTHNVDRFCALQEVIGPGFFLTPGHHAVTVRMVGGKGQIKISDMVLFFTVNV